MKKNRIALRLLAFPILIIFAASIAQAQATRTWVSGVGDDVNPCSRTAPCKTFSGAISKTAEGGEISVLDPGGFGALTITKAITIDGVGTQASILGAGTNGINVNILAGSAHGTDAVVILRNLNINGASQASSPGVSGINYVRGASLLVDHVNIYNFGTTGININVGEGGFLAVQDSIIQNTNTGIKAFTCCATLNVSIKRVTLQNQGTGLDVQSGTTTISDSLVTKNSTAGIVAGGTLGSVVNVENSTITYNGIGVNAANGFGTVRLSNNGIYRNNTGLSNSGTMQTFKNNEVTGNTTDVNGVLTDISGSIR
ncbi:MAG TPA: right-handed parallel beta-helix repeat-containing protein [Pyrinomonadaceae bacterium]